ncbi:hypothetical protein [Demequina sp.]|uniref:hypothetical protein n=1 Tax=Demequina sp. TaxID=2050685 RepID=UPI0025E505CC|nr:hypothetical protein [Demequina sp.]
MKLPARLVTLAAVAVVAAGCSAINPITTQDPYDASDGISVDIGDVRGINLLVVTEAEGSPAVLLGSLYNSSAEDVQVAASIDGESIVTIDVAAGATVKLGGEDGEQHVTGTASVAPGLLQDVILQTDAAGQVVTAVPVMDGTLPEYEPELPSA